MSNNWFADWFNSHYYHLLYKNRDNKEANNFIENIINYLQPKPDSLMLDVACGKGRHSIALNKMGFDVSGIDLSPNSIEYALQFANDKLHFYVHDMRLPFWINYFDYAFNLFTSFGYFRTNRENENAIRTIANGLKPGGHFIIDFLNVNNVIANQVSEETIEKENVTFTINRSHDDNYIYKKIHISDTANNVSGEAHTERVMKIKLADFEAMFNKYGLQIKKVFGNYNLDEYNENSSKRLIIVAKKQ